MTLSIKLALIANKIGETLTANLYLFCENDDEKSFGIKDIAGGKSASYLREIIRINFVIIMGIQ